MQSGEKPIPMPSGVKSYPASSTTFAIDRTGAVFDTAMGGSPFAQRVYRTAPNEKPAIVFENAGAHGQLVVNNRKLYMAYTDANWYRFYIPIPGYIDPDDKPSSNIVNVDESAMRIYTAQVAIAIANANNAISTANDAKRIAAENNRAVADMQSTIQALQTQITVLQAKVLSQSQVEDIAWAKTWDILYLIRLGYINNGSAIQQVRDWLNDLRDWIRRDVVK